jgi:hypothetical protein
MLARSLFNPDQIYGLLKWLLNGDFKRSALIEKTVQADLVHPVGP